MQLALSNSSLSTAMPTAMRFTRSIYESRLSQARQDARAHETQEIARVAEQVVQFLQQAVRALSPILGESSVSAIYKHSLYRTRTQHPWLSVAYGEIPQPEVLTVLQSTVLRQTLRNAKSAVNDLVNMFHELLNNLIGTSLARRLLGQDMGSEAL